ncbi:MAG: hypothetical protein IKU83_06965 [Lachnospiraceae bacterium]|nr:hypothetical protein [Lachnospiraceae bacterium]
MKIYTEQLRELQAKTARKKHVLSMLKALEQNQSALSEKVKQLDEAQKKEQLDVDRLENGSLKAFFYNVVGKMDEKLTKEREEAYQAAVKYQAAVRELDAVEYDLRQYTDELQSLENCEEQYQSLFEKAIESAKENGGDVAKRVLSKEAEIAEREEFLKEVREAIAAGQTAKARAKKVQEHLEEADDLSTWDLLGGGLLVDIMKHDELDAAQVQIEKLQVELSRFKTELTDVSVEADFRVDLDDFSRFADWFFDGLFMDWAIKDEIEDSMTRMQEVKKRIETVLKELAELETNTQAQKEQLTKELEAILMT